MKEKGRYVHGEINKSTLGVHAGNQTLIRKKGEKGRRDLRGGERDTLGILRTKSPSLCGDFKKGGERGENGAAG